MFYSELCKISKSAFFTERLRWLLLWFILVASINVTWVSWILASIFSTEIFQILVWTYLLCVQQKVFGVFIFPYVILSWYILVQSMELFKVCLKHSQNRYFFSFSIHKRHIIVQTNRQNKTSIKFFKVFLQIKLL